MFLDLPVRLQLNLGQDVLTDFLYYWQEDRQFTNKQVGCTVICVSKKLNLLDKAGRLSQPDAEAYVKTAGGDENLAKYLVYLYQSCQKVVNETEPCENALQTTNCFRKAVQRAKYSPDVPVEVRQRSDG
ncbi:hypothetical protein ABMA27_006346 [Loxostege sticticalis]|uniref:Uncharacterized protein n=1 Tax=Loxostege sticticalis TaxID=481309 RepID=A0ABR3HII1_LOXSC